MNREVHADDIFRGVRTLRTQDTSDLRQFGTSAEVSVGHFDPFIKCWDTSALVQKCPKDSSAPCRHHAQHRRCKKRF